MDKESYDALAKSLEPFRAGTSEWRFSAKEILGLAAYKEGKKAEAERLYREIISDGAAPPGMRQRAQVYAGAASRAVEDGAGRTNGDKGRGK